MLLRSQLSFPIPTESQIGVMPNFFAPPVDQFRTDTQFSGYFLGVSSNIAQLNSLLLELFCKYSSGLCLILLRLLYSTLNFLSRQM